MPHIFLKKPQLTAVEVRNIFCIGRNYSAHIAELGNRPEDDPVVFLKPTSALHLPGEPIRLPAHSNDVHYETELVLLIGKGGKNIAPEQALEHVAGYGLGLDLTARDLQSRAKQGGLPWTVAKGFDCSATVTDFIPADHCINPDDIRFEMHLNHQLTQQGDTRKMLFSVPLIVHYLSTVFTLQEGDLVFTGTPEGVGCLSENDTLRLVWPHYINQDYVVFSNLN